ncbi:MAG: hypothetical protein E5299_01790 [Burkholderia gladioli]|nr:MAG: hypothetical protein E5299_01790 [Burkholderia gladioli]
MTIWINEAVLAKITDAIPTRGRPCVYGDTLIQALLGVKTVYRRTLRALQGFTQSLRDLAFPSLPVPNYTTLCRRAKTLDVELPILRDNEPIHLVVDSTGLKVHGEGEWKGAPARLLEAAHVAVKLISRSTRIRVKCMPR